MQYRRHVIPTHLQVVDKALYGLALGQVMTILRVFQKSERRAKRRTIRPIIAI